MKKFLITVGCLLWASSVFAEVPRRHIAYARKITDASGNVVNDTLPMKFRLYDALSGGNQEWEEVRGDAEGDSIIVTNGFFNLLLGSQTAIDLNFNEQYWLETQIGDDTLSPRGQLSMYAYAFRSIHSDTADYATGVIGDSVPYADSAGVAANSWALNGQDSSYYLTDSLVWSDALDSVYVYQGGILRGGCGIPVTEDDLTDNDLDDLGDVSASSAYSFIQRNSGNSNWDMVGLATFIIGGDGITVTVTNGVATIAADLGNGLHIVNNEIAVQAADASIDVSASGIKTNLGAKESSSTNYNLYNKNY